MSKTFCVAVGDAGSRTTRSALIETWDGTQWQLVDAPDSGLPSTQLLGVNCPSPAFCVAVGAAGPSATTATTLIGEIWNGSNWTVSRLRTGDGAELTAVSCVSAAFCLAVGDLRTAERQSLVAERWDGTSWTAAKVPQPFGSQAQLSTISCVSTTYCLAVGTYLDHIIGEDTVAVTWNGSAFVAGSAPYFYHPVFAVRCFSADQCVGVGIGAQNLDRIYWTLESVPPHDGAQLPTQLQAVSCMTSTSCLAVGTEYDDGEPLALLSNGAQWRLTGGSAEEFGAADNATSCGDTMPTSCLLSGSINLHGPTPPETLVERFNGRYYDFEPGVPNVGVSKAISCVGDFCVVAGVHAVAIFDGTSWTSMPISSPGGSRVELNGLDCVSADDCVLVGGYDSSPGVESVLVERWNGTGWTVVAAPPGPAQRSNALNAVTCTSSDSCVAVGTSHGSSDASLVYEWDGVAWRSIAHPGTGTGLDAVACASAGLCLAVGRAGAMIASSNGTWARSRIAVPPGDTGSLPDLTGITYTEGTYRVVGSYDRLGSRIALAESLTG